MKIVGLGAAAVAAKTPVMAGPFEASDFEKLIPADKKLSAEWIASLFAKGTRTVYRSGELEKIGMPIGGICTGQVYLGGDGRLWHWDIFNQRIDSGFLGLHYANPMKPTFPFEQGFALRTTAGGQSTIRSLDCTGFSDVRFTGEYPLGLVDYGDAASPVSVSLEAFSPFIPLNADDSHLPAVVLNFTVKNTAASKVDGELAGWLENAVCLHSADICDGTRTNAIARTANAVVLNCTGVSTPVAPNTERPPIVFADFEGNTFAPWKVDGEAFGDAPAKGNRSDIQHLSNYQGAGLVNSWTGSDEPRGKLTSPEFTIERPFISFQIGGGNYANDTCIRLLIDGTIVRTATGKNSDALEWTDWAVRSLIGKKAHFEIIDNASGGWGHVDIDQIEFRDTPRTPAANIPPKEQPDYGTMSLALLDPKPTDAANAAVSGSKLPDAVFSEQDSASNAQTKPFQERLLGSLARKFSLEPGQAATVTFVVAWHFSNIRHLNLPDMQGRRYGKRFADSQAVVAYLAANLASLTKQTRLWHDTWYDSTLPYWFLDRTFLNTSILATSTCYWLGNNRFYAWEGVGCCEGTCQHVWQYAQAMGRIFPSLERTTREMVDYGLAFHPDTGAMDFRAEYDRTPALDGQSGTILRAYREHQMSADDGFLRRNWPKIKKSIEFMIEKDPNHDGILEGSAMNTLDTPWFGKIAWLCSLYAAALRAGEQMALEMGDEAFAKLARSIADAGFRNIDEQLFNGEYYYQIGDKDHPNAIGSYNGCEIDQVFGQSSAFQVGLERVLPREHTLTALRSLWKYNFTPDVGAFRNANKPGRWYAMPGEGGLVLCSWPQGDQLRVQTGFDSYFNECMSGFEYQVASHMIWEGMVQEGLAITRAIHDRYHASRRNPWNEVECGDHYARAMASYGVYLAACGYQYHGPKGYLAFAPRLTPENFRAAFTAAEGWGTFAQKREAGTQTEQIEIHHGKLRLTSLAFEVDEKAGPCQASVLLDGKPVPSKTTRNGTRLRIVLDSAVIVEPGKGLQVRIAAS